MKPIVNVRAITGPIAANGISVYPLVLYAKRYRAMKDIHLFEKAKESISQCQARVQELWAECHYIRASLTLLVPPAVALSVIFIALKH